MQLRLTVCKSMRQELVGRLIKQLKSKVVQSLNACF